MRSAATSQRTAVLCRSFSASEAVACTPLPLPVQASGPGQEVPFDARVIGAKASVVQHGGAYRGQDECGSLWRPACKNGRKQSGWNGKIIGVALRVAQLAGFEAHELEGPSAGERCKAYARDQQRRVPGGKQLQPARAGFAEGYITYLTITKPEITIATVPSATASRRFSRKSRMGSP